MTIEGGIGGDGLVLRSLSAEDCTDRYAAWLNDPQVNRFLETRFVEWDADSVRAFVDGVNGSPDSHLFGIFADGLHVGNVKIGPDHPRYRFADISYFIGDRSHWGCGHAARAVRLATEFGFGRLGLNRIQAGVHGDNVGSRRVLERNGYRMEAVLRRKVYHGLGEGKVWDDHVWYGLLREEHPPGGGL